MASDFESLINHIETQAELDDIVCNKDRSKDLYIPSSVDYANLKGSLPLMWGVSVSGLPIFNTLSKYGTDLFDPVQFEECTNVSECRELVDAC